MMLSFQIPKPSDMHLHVRQGDMLQLVTPHTSKQFCQAVIMPNTSPPITNLELLRNYRDEILAAAPIDHDFKPLMTMYLSPQIELTDIREGKESGDLHAIKLYPFGVTTNSEHGAKSLKDVASHLTLMEELGVPLLIHGEDSDPKTDVFDREKIFYQETLQGIIKDYPDLKITCEHITTKVAADFIATASENIGATITPQHLGCDRNDMLGNGINPHLYCKPILKRSEDREALLKLVFSGHPRVFAGTDSAPHTKDKKECDCGCAGVYSASHAIEHYAKAFDDYGDLSKPETQEIFGRFMSYNGPDFYELEAPEDLIILQKKASDIPKNFTSEEGDTLIPWQAGEKTGWSVV